MSPKEVVQQWMDAYNANDASAIAALYTDFATNHPTYTTPVVGRSAICEWYAAHFADKEAMCISDNLFEDGEWAVLESYDHKGFRSCGIFHVIEGLIVFQRSYGDQLSYQRLHGITPPSSTD